MLYLVDFIVQKIIFLYILSHYSHNTSMFCAFLLLHMGLYTQFAEQMTELLLISITISCAFFTLFYGFIAITSKSFLTFHTKYGILCYR